MKSLLHKLSARSSQTRRLSADSDCFHYIGRLDYSRPGAVGFIWQASSVEILFTGTQVSLGFAKLQGQVFFNLEIDGHTQILKVKNGWVTIPAGQGEHHLKLFKRSEANAGQVDFLGISLAEGAKTRRPEIAPRLRYIFYGDSITAGACNEDAEDEQWLDRGTHNSALSYAALTATAMGADHHNIAVSGIGVVVGYEPYTAAQIWNRMAYRPKAATAPLHDWVADIVFVNYGENDDSFTRNNGLPFPDSFTTDYVNLITAIRAGYPSARIILLRGGMVGGAQSEALGGAWREAVAQLERRDAGISHFEFHHYAPHHPRVSDHQLMARELISWLQANSPGTQRER